MARVRNLFNVSISEVGENGLWGRTTLGMACVGNDRRFVESCLSKVLQYAEKDPEMQLLDYSMEIL